MGIDLTEIFMKILLIDVYNFKKGGAETVCFNTGKMLEEHGHEVIYFTLKWDKNNPSPYSKYFPESKETRRGPLKQMKNLVNYFYHFEAARKLEQLIKNEHPDLAHIHLMWGQITPSIFPVLKRHHIPILYTVHDFRIVCPAYTFRNGKGQICEQCQGKYFYRCIVNSCTKGNRLLSVVMAAEQYFRNAFFNPARYIDGFIYVSSFAKDLQEKYMLAVKKTPNIVLHNFSTFIIRHPKSMPEEKYYLFFGRLSHEKGVQTLINAIDGISQCKLKIVGTGPLEENLKKEQKEKYIGNVEFLGYKSGKELTDLVSAAYFVIVPSEWYENNPMTIIEAYSVGTPVIGARIGGIPEIVIDGKTGFQFESGNADDLREKLVHADKLNDNEYSELSANTIRFANENLSKDIYWKKLEAFYGRFIKIN